MCISKFRPLFLSIAILSFASAASAQPDTPTRVQEDPAPQWLELGIAPALEFGRGVTSASVISPFLTIRTWEGLRLGASFTPAVGITDGMEGCSTVAVCNNARWRASGRAEYQFGTRGFRPWLAVELGRERWSGTDMTTSGFPEVSGVRTVWAGQAGFDGVMGYDGGAVGLGLFATAVGDGEGTGLGAGARLVLGFF